MSGSGPISDYYKVLENSWQAIVSSFLPSNVFSVVDTETGEIGIAHELAIDINGRKDGHSCWFQGKNVL